MGYSPAILYAAKQQGSSISQTCSPGIKDAIDLIGPVGGFQDGVLVVSLEEFLE